MLQLKNKKILKLSVYLIVIVFLFLAAFGFWLYTGTLTAVKIKIFSRLPLPMALVGSQNVQMSQFLIRYSIAQKLPDALPAGSNTLEIKTDVYNQLVSEAETAIVAQKYGVDVTQSQIDAEYQYDEAGQTDFNSLLQQYGANEDLYKNQVIKPALLADNLEIWFNSQPDLNQGLYSQANSMASQIEKGADMGTLAAENSTDQTGKAVSGDLGFVDVSQLLPELREPIENMKVGDVKILPSRYGLHIIRLEGIKDNLLHLRQIFLANPGFQTWYNSQNQTIKIEKLIAI